MPQTPSKNYPKEILVERMSLIHKPNTNGEVETNFLEGERPMFDRVVIYESLFRSFLSGAVLIHDKDAKGIKNAFSPGDTIEMRLRSPGRGESDAGRVYEIKVVVQKIESMTPKETPQIRGYALHFASPSYVFYNQVESDHVFDEFFGKISNNERSDNFQSSFLEEGSGDGGDGDGGDSSGQLMDMGIDDTFGSDEADLEESESEDDKNNLCPSFDYEKRGFVNDLIKNKLSVIDGVEYDIEATKNSIWYRQFFPLTSAKLHDYKTQTIHSLLSEAKNFAQNKENPYAVNYYFWQDLDGYHFSSVENLIKKQESVFNDDELMIENNKVFVHAADITQQPSYAKFNRVNKIKVTQYVDLLKLISSGAFGSLYRYWMKPRFDLVVQTDFTENEINFEMSKEEINYLIDKNTYSYFYPRDRVLWRGIEDVPIVSQTIDNVELFKPSLTNIIRPQTTTTTKNDYEHGYNILDDSPLTSFYNHYLHTDLDLCVMKDILFIQRAITDPTQKFYNHLTRRRIWDFKKKEEEVGCGVPISYSFYSSDQASNNISPGTRHFSIGLDPPFEEPTIESIVDIAAAIPDECSLIEGVLGERWLGCASRDYWYYGSLQRSTPTAKKLSHTNAELTYFKDLCSSSPDVIRELKLDGESDSIDWKKTFPGLFSEGPLCTCPCQNSSQATMDENFYKYMEYTNTFSRYWNTDNWTPLMRNAQHQLFKSQQLQFSTSGNLQRKPGEMIFLHLPVVTAQTDVEVDLSHGEFMQGKYMISSIKHNITSNNEHTMEVEVCRDGFSSQYSAISPKTLGVDGMVNTNNEWIGDGYEGEIVGSLGEGVVGDVGNAVVGGIRGAIDVGTDYITDATKRTLDMPGYLHPDDYSFFGPPNGGGGGFGGLIDDGIGGLIDGGLLIDGAVESFEDDEDDDEGGSEDSLLNVIDGKSIAQLYKESFEEDSRTKQELDFVSDVMTEIGPQNFSRYDWGNYGIISGHTDTSGDDEDSDYSDIDGIEDLSI